jgi:hypothetical protein
MLSAPLALRKGIPDVWRVGPRVFVMVKVDPSLRLPPMPADSDHAGPRMRWRVRRCFRLSLRLKVTSCGSARPAEIRYMLPAVCSRRRDGWTLQERRRRKTVAFAWCCDAGLVAWRMSLDVATQVRTKSHHFLRLQLHRMMVSWNSRCSSWCGSLRDRDGQCCCRSYRSQISPAYALQTPTCCKAHQPPVVVY